MKTFLLSAAIFLIFGGFSPTSTAFAEDAGELFEKLTCHTCHGPQGKGMIRTEDKAKYSLKKKKMYKKLVKKGMPVKLVKKMKPLYKKKFKEKEKFISAIAENIGEAEAEEYKDLIISIAGRVYYHKGDLIPGFEDYPRHAGNKSIYLYQQMKDILEGKRTNGNTEAMRGVMPYIESNNIKDEDFWNIAEYLSNVKLDE